MSALLAAQAPAAYAQSTSQAGSDDSTTSLGTFSGQFIGCMAHASDFSSQKHCMELEARRQDLRLNGAYQTLRRHRSEMREDLAVVQRLWLQYRDSNCGLLAVLAPDTDSSAVVTMCRMNMAAQRATELEAMQD